MLRHYDTCTARLQCQCGQSGVIQGAIILIQVEGGTLVEGGLPGVIQGAIGALTRQGAALYMMIDNT